MLADFVEVADPAWEKAAEDFLHEELEYVVVNDWHDANRGVELMRADPDGRATFLVHPEPSGRLRASGRYDPRGAGHHRAVCAIACGLPTASTHAPAELAARAWRNCFLAADRATAQRLRSAYPDCYFLLPDGVSYHGHAVSGGKKTGGGPLALKRELRELAGQVEQKQLAWRKRNLRLRSWTKKRQR